MTMSYFELEELAYQANKTNNGTWYSHVDLPNVALRVGAAVASAVLCGTRSLAMFGSEADAKYVSAASPKEVLKLISELRDKEARIMVLEARLGSQE
jgi:hypothetical protein